MPSGRAEAAEPMGGADAPVIASADLGALGPGVDPRALGTGVWVELSVAADIEAVEAVSEILTRFAPGGTSVEPGFSLTDEGLGAVVDPTKPAICLLYTSPSPRDGLLSRMPSSA